jgi:NAD(P)-dependent dehydrogenase (short-subunit alcohol dehydrogenase family)
MPVLDRLSNPENLGRIPPLTSSSFPLCGGVVVVAAAASGIGRALALEFAVHGSALALLDCDFGSLASVPTLARQSGVTVSEHDVDKGNAAAMAALPMTALAVYGRVNLLVNNAGWR